MQQKALLAPVLAGLTAGSVAAVAAVLLSLPLKSPNDAFLNSLSVALGSVLAGLGFGVLWRLLLGRRQARAWYVKAWIGSFAVVALAGIIGEALMQGMAAFVVPLAAIAIGVAGLLTPVLAAPLATRWWAAPAAFIVAMALAVPLAGWADGGSGTLTLPEVALPQPAATSVPVTVSLGASPSPVPTKQVTSRLAGQYSGLTFAVGAGSKATFTVREQLSRVPLPNDAVVSTTALTGEVHFDGRPSVVQMDLSRMSSDESLRDRYIRSTMFPRDPIATFTVNETRTLQEGTPKGQTVTGQVTGTLTLKGKTFPMMFEMEGRDDGDVGYLLGKTSFTWSQLGLAPPDLVGIVKVEDKVAVEILLALRPK